MKFPYIVNVILSLLIPCKEWESKPKLKSKARSSQIRPWLFNIYRMPITLVFRDKNLYFLLMYSLFRKGIKSITNVNSKKKVVLLLAGLHINVFWKVRFVPLVGFWRGQVGLQVLRGIRSISKINNDIELSLIS